MAAEAIGALQHAAALSGGRDSAHLAYAYVVTGRPEEGARILASVMKAEANKPELAVHLAMVYGALGQSDEAFKWLDVGYRERASFMVGLKIDPAFERLHDDPRWDDLMKRMGLD
jgi:hypothetical protein